LPLVAKAEAEAAARDPAAAGAELQRILQQSPADYANARAAFLQAAVPEDSKSYVTMAVGVAENSEGNRYVLISTTETGGGGISYVRPSVRPLVQPDEIRVPALSLPDGTQQHAEINILDFAKANDVNLIAVGAGRAYCFECGPALDAAGVLATGPRKK
jgi:hypothetical protein